MPRVRLPEGCYGLDCADGTKYTAKPGDTVEVSEGHARAIKKSFYGSRGIMRAGMTFGAIGTRAGRRCADCNFLGQAWANTCPRCGGDTIEESSR